MQRPRKAPAPAVVRRTRHTWTRELMDLLPEAFRVMVAQPALLDTLLQSGINEHLDGVWAIAPHWAMRVGEAAGRGDWSAAAEHRQALSHLRGMISRLGMPVATTLLNARGIPGNFAPRPYRPLSKDLATQILQDKVVMRLLAEHPFEPSSQQAVATAAMTQSPPRRKRAPFANPPR
jgi:dihydrodipicolinate synthase/N-acetylneuraminate lyase